MGRVGPEKLKRAKAAAQLGSKRVARTHEQWKELNRLLGFVDKAKYRPPKKGKTLRDLVHVCKPRIMQELALGNATLKDIQEQFAERDVKISIETLKKYLRIETDYEAHRRPPEGGCATRRVWNDYKYNCQVRDIVANLEWDLVHPRIQSRFLEIEATLVSRGYPPPPRYVKPGETPPSTDRADPTAFAPAQALPTGRRRPQSAASVRRSARKQKRAKAD